MDDSKFLNLADARLGAVVLSATDEFFGAKERLLNPSEPEWRAGVYDDHGKWMDGWETRRLRIQGFDHCIVQLAAPKGTLPHRTIGWIWVVLMLTISVSAFFIHTIRLWGPLLGVFWSPIHLLAIFTLATLPIAVWRGHRHDVSGHRNAMISLYCGALVIAGLFTFWPGRIMHAVLFGS